MNERLKAATERLNKTIENVDKQLDRVFLDMNTVFVEADKVFEEVAKEVGDYWITTSKLTATINGVEINIRAKPGESVTVTFDDKGNVLVNGEPYDRDRHSGAADQTILEKIKALFT